MGALGSRLSHFFLVGGEEKCHRPDPLSHSPVGSRQKVLVMERCSGGSLLSALESPESASGCRRMSSWWSCTVWLRLSLRCLLPGQATGLGQMLTGRTQAPDSCSSFPLKFRLKNST
ncbi:hypothetical protein AAY473_023412 [Plecturocebus cupreus]